LVNKAKVLGSKKWTDHMLTKHMMRAYTSMNYNMVVLIHHKMYIEEVNHVKNLSKGITTTRKQEIAFKANKKSKDKQVVVESSSEEEEEQEEEEEEEEDSSECDAEDMALFMKKFKKYMKKKFSK
jgi:NACalpha-BTF3-like transcription factor